jgi:hypothetical protein
MSTIRVGTLTAEGGNFEALTIQHDGDSTVLDTGFDDMAEHLDYLLGMSICSYIEVVGFSAKDRVTHSSSDNPGFKACSS